MASKTLNTRIQIRNDLAATWTEKNPVLLKGEMGVETDTRKIKIGDGLNKWSALGYSGADVADIEKVIADNRDTTYSLEPTGEQTDAQALSTIESPKDGDTAIIKRVISGDKFSYTAYVYDGAWKAMDGNYNAENVYFADNLTYTAPIGVLTVPSSGSGTIASSGKNVKDVLASILAKEKNPSITQPSASMDSSNIGAYEAGTNVTINYSISTNPGSYTYGPATGVTFSGHKATFNNETVTGASGTFTSVQVTDSTNLSISGSVDYSDGAIPVTNLGNNYTSGQIKAGSKTLSKGTLTGYRNWFYGYKAGGATIDVSALDSAKIRALKAQNGSFPATLSTNKMQQMFFAIPKGRKTEVSVANNVNGAPCTVTKVTDVMVEGANHFDAIAYDVWYVNNAAADGGSNTYKITVK